MGEGWKERFRRDSAARQEKGAVRAPTLFHTCCTHASLHRYRLRIDGRKFECIVRGVGEELLSSALHPTQEPPSDGKHRQETRWKTLPRPLFFFPRKESSRTVAAGAFSETSSTSTISVVSAGGECRAVHFRALSGCCFPCVRGPRRRAQRRVGKTNLLSGSFFPPVFIILK